KEPKQALLLVSSPPPVGETAKGKGEEELLASATQQFTSCSRRALNGDCWQRELQEQHPHRLIPGPASGGGLHGLLSMTKSKRMDGYILDADVVDSGATRTSLEASFQDQLEKKVLLIVGDCTPDRKACSAKEVNKTAKRTVVGHFQASTDVAITKLMQMGGDFVNADAVVFYVTGTPLQALDKDQLAEENGVIVANAVCDMTSPEKCICPLKLLNVVKMEYADVSTLSSPKAEMSGKVARVKASVADGKVSSELVISVNPRQRTKLTCPQLRVTTMGQVWLFLLVILFSASHVLADAKKESAQIGSCRFDMTSVASLSCVKPGGIWRPPSVACCNALRYAIDILPSSNESGACCLCRYMFDKYTHFALATSYVLCQGKDRDVVTTWSLPLNCYRACRQRNDSFPAPKEFPVVNVQDISISKLWIAAVAAVALSAILFVAFCCRWWRKPVLNSGERRPTPQRRGPPNETWGRHSSAQRRMSPSKGSPNS
ncbi:hypothetical protein EJB05_13698, partial [Eragrostis curvula]